MYVVVAVYVRVEMFLPCELKSLYRSSFGRPRPWLISCQCENICFNDPADTGMCAHNDARSRSSRKRQTLILPC
jgi:hypothetical protein